MRSSAFGFLAIAFASATVRADIFAALCVRAPAPRTDLDIAILNASVGTRITLPAGINTTAEERHPCISTDGNRLTFDRLDFLAGTTRIIVVDRSTGQSADLFNGFEAAQIPPADPAITPDGILVATGSPSQPSGSSFFPQLTLTDLQSFPTGPFTRSVLSFPNSTSFQLRVANVAAGGGNLFAFQTIGFPQVRGRLFLTQVNGNSSGPLLSDTFSYGHPAMAANNPQFVLFDAWASTSGTSNIMFRPATVATFVGTPTALPAIVNSTEDESQPAVTADGRYVAFVRHSGSDFHDRLFVWDSQTQILLNPSGVDLGLANSRVGGAVSLYVKTVITVSTISLSGAVTATLTEAARVGIFVQRITGRTEILGRKAYELETVGRVPLGTFPEGMLRTHWDLQVDGQPLEPGCYLVTLRALEGTTVREFGRPRVLRIREKHGFQETADDDDTATN